MENLEYVILSKFGSGKVEVVATAADRITADAIVSKYQTAYCGTGWRIWWKKVWR